MRDDEDHFHRWAELHGNRVEISVGDHEEDVEAGPNFLRELLEEFSESRPAASDNSDFLNVRDVPDMRCGFPFRFRITRDYYSGGIRFCEEGFHLLHPVRHVVARHGRGRIDETQEPWLESLFFKRQDSLDWNEDTVSIFLVQILGSPFRALIIALVSLHGFLFTRHAAQEFGGRQGWLLQFSESLFGQSWHIPASYHHGTGTKHFLGDTLLG